MMMYDSRPFGVQDYPIYKQWLADRDRIALRYEDLPSEGMLVMLNKEPICAGFIFKTHQSMCNIGGLASDPNKTGKIRGLAVDYLLDQLMIDAKSLGYTMVVLTTNKQKLLDRLNKRGFTLFDDNLVQMGRGL